MKTKNLLLTTAALLAGASLSAQAQNVVVGATISDVPGSGGTFNYTLTMKNLGSEAIQSLWVGWIPGVFDISNPSNPGNNLGWSSGTDGDSLQYIGSPLAPGATGIFTFVSTSTPAQFTSHAAGDSTAYGVNAANGQLSFELSGADTETFNPTVVATPEPSTVSLLVLGACGFANVFRRKLRGQ